MTIPKFRVYDKVECMMITTSDYEDLSDLFCLLKADADTGYYSELMQFTGLTDKNGQEIFEGDVVICYDEQDEYGPYPCQIFFCEDNLAWNLKELPTEDKYTMSEYSWDEIEVIGNIYENPELVEVENE